MSPIRLVILAILIYIGYLLIKGGTGRKSKKEENTSDTEEHENQSSLSDVLVEDPVCKKLVPQQQAIPLQHEGETIYFCSKECCNKFVSEKGAEQ